MQALNKHDIHLQAYWLHTGPDPVKEGNLKLMLDALKRNQVKTQIWLMGTGINLSPLSQQEKIVAIKKPVKHIAEEAAKIGCAVGLYNHGGWYGEPENQLAIIDYLQMPNMGIVYNFHHAEEQVDRFPEFFPKLLPPLYALNLSGLKGKNPAKVVPVGDGDIEANMIRIVQESGYIGPVGIINEETHPDAKQGLLMNMHRVEKVLKHLGYNREVKTYE